MLRSERGHQPFEQDAKKHQGYRYTTEAPLSALVANQRLTTVTCDWLGKSKKIRTVMDLGCGDGTYTAAVANSFPKIKFQGCDPAASAIKLAQKAYPQLDFLVADLLKVKTLPLPVATASIVRGVIHHLPNHRQGVINAIQYSPHVLIIEPNGWNPILKIIEKLSPYHRAHGERSFTSQTLVSWVKAGGGRVEKVSFVGLVPFFCPKKLVLFLKKIEPLVEASWLAPLLCAQVILEVERNDSTKM